MKCTSVDQKIAPLYESFQLLPLNTTPTPVAASEKWTKKSFVSQMLCLSHLIRRVESGKSGSDSEVRKIEIQRKKLRKHEEKTSRRIILR